MKDLPVAWLHLILGFRNHRHQMLRLPFLAPLILPLINFRIGWCHCSWEKKIARHWIYWRPINGCRNTLSYACSSRLDDLELGEDQVGAERKGREESGEAEVPDDHERSVFACTTRGDRIKHDEMLPLLKHYCIEVYYIRVSDAACSLACQTVSRTCHVVVQVLIGCTGGQCGGGCSHGSRRRSHS